MSKVSTRDIAEKFSDKLNRRQLEALQANTPKPNDILQDGFMQEVNTEIEQTYDQQAAKAKWEQDVQREDLDVELQQKVNTRVFNSQQASTKLEKAVKKMEKTMPAQPQPVPARRSSPRPLPVAEPDMTFEPTGSLDEELDLIQAEQEQATVPEVDVKDQLLGFLSKLKNAPTAQQVQALKAKHNGNLFITGFSEEEMYLYTSLTRGQWKSIQKILKKEQDGGSPDGVQDILEEKIVNYCVVWPSLNTEFWVNSKAGVSKALYEAIMLQSCFWTPEQTMAVTARL